MEFIKIASTISQFKSINTNISNVEDVYRNNLLLWFVNNSDTKETKDGKGIEIHNNTILNPENIIVSKTKKEFKISENDFIKDQLELLDSLNTKLLSFTEKKQLDIYKDHLNKK